MTVLDKKFEGQFEGGLRIFMSYMPYVECTSPKVNQNLLKTFLSKNYFVWLFFVILPKTSKQQIQSNELYSAY